MDVVDKADFKVLVATDIGATIEDSLEAAKAEIPYVKGRRDAYTDAAKFCSSVAELAKADLDNGVFDLQTAAIVNRFIDRCRYLCETNAVKAESLGYSVRGKVGALESVVKTLAEYRKVAELRAVEAKAEAAEPAKLGKRALRLAQREEDRAAEEAAIPEPALEAGVAPEPAVDPPEPAVDPPEPAVDPPEPEVEHMLGQEPEVEHMPEPYVPRSTIRPTAKRGRSR